MKVAEHRPETQSRPYFNHTQMMRGAWAGSILLLLGVVGTALSLTLARNNRAPLAFSLSVAGVGLGLGASCAALLRRADQISKNQARHAAQDAAFSSSRAQLDGAMAELKEMRGS
jgi:uncharacterized membrane protein YeiB